MNDERWTRLCERLEEIGPVAVAFSGGVDSSLLLAAAHDALGEQAVALTLVTPQMASWETREAQRLADRLGVRQRLVAMPLLERLRDNPPDRCYLCKQALFMRLRALADAEHLGQVVDGTNYDDLGGDRPGLRALRELGIRSPLAECRLTKADLRALSRERGLPTWDKSAYACLLTRLPHNTLVDESVLQGIEAAERWLIERGYRDVRVRCHGTLARIEIDRSQGARLLDVAQEVVDALRALGFEEVALDLCGYRAGTMDPPRT